MNAAIFIPSRDLGEGLSDLINEIQAKNQHLTRKIAIVVMTDKELSDSPSFFKRLKQGRAVAVVPFLTSSIGLTIKKSFAYYLSHFDESYCFVRLLPGQGVGCAAIFKCIEMQKRHETSLIVGAEESDKPISDVALSTIPRHSIQRIMSESQSRFEQAVRQVLPLLPGEMGAVSGVGVCQFESPKSGETKMAFVWQFIYPYLKFLKFVGSSLLSTVVDIGLFTVIMAMLKSLIGGNLIFLSTAIARVGSTLFNYQVNKKAVFAGGSSRSSLLKFYSLAVVKMLVSAFCVSLLVSKVGGVSPTSAKIVSDTLLFFINYLIQKKWIFVASKAVDG